LLDYNMPEITIRVVCSKGTYIRALARDIGEALQSGAHLIKLERTRIGEVTLDKCFSLDEFEKQIPAWKEEHFNRLEEENNN
ncbi:MAG: tRNA pseudouridine(55) synthase, partial [Paludibacteraceae bacterium]|nr:tRNA pseudouridine(55) synthase [Paludibacteraceae bacterium]